MVQALDFRIIFFERAGQRISFVIVWLQCHVGTLLITDLILITLTQEFADNTQKRLPNREL